MSSIPGEGCGELSEGKLTRDNWHPLNMALGTWTVYPDKQNKGLSSTFQPPEEGQSVQRPKRFDKHGDKDEDCYPKNVNNVNKIMLKIPKLGILWKLGFHLFKWIFTSIFFSNNSKNIFLWSLLLFWLLFMQ